MTLIADSLLKIVHAIRGEEKPNDRLAVADALKGNGILEAPAWMEEFVNSIANSCYT